MSTVSTSPDSQARRWFRVLLLPAFALSLLGALWLAVFHQLDTEQHSNRKEATTHSQALARVLSDHVSHILRQTDHATQLFKLKYEETRGGLRFREFARRNGLLDSVLPARLDLPMALYDRAGRLADSANAALEPDVAALPFFQALARTDANTPLFSTPVVDARTHKWHIQVARRLVDAGGRFDGVIVILIDPMVFVDDYDRLNLGEQDALVLLQRQAGLSVGRIGDALFIEADLRFGPARAAASAPGELQAAPPPDAIGRVYGASEMPRYGLEAIVGVTEAHAMRRYQRHRKTYLNAAFGASMLIVLVVTVLMRQSAQLRASMEAARTDIKRRRQQEQSLRTSEAQLLAVTNASPLGLLRTELNGSCTYLNRRIETITGRPREQILGKGWIDAVHPDDRILLDGLFEHQRQHEEPFQRMLRCVHPDGRVVWVSMKAAAVRIGGRIEGFVGSLDDITVLREAELALRESEARLRTIADTMPAMVAYVDAGQVYRFHNLAYGREFGREGMAVPGRTIRDTMGLQRHHFLLPYIERALSGETLIFEEQDQKSGAERTMEVTYIPQWGEDGESVVGFHVMRQDITSQQREKKRLLRLAQIDPLTGLANRAGFLAKLDTAMQDSRAHGRLMALMYMDIDRFKPVNDTWGHAVGDKLLKAFSGRLTHALRGTDTVARLGGDEFTIIMEGLGKPDDAVAAATKIVAAMRVPFELDGVSVLVSASIGLTWYRDGAQDGEALLKQADMLLYEAKQAGRDTFRAAPPVQRAASA